MSKFVWGGGDGGRLGLGGEGKMMSYFREYLVLGATATLVCVVLHIQ